jgi:hypothetical protein
MKTIKINDWVEIPENFTGVAEYPNGTKHWYKEGKLHREDGPAIIWTDGYKSWYKEGKYHRENGPAIERLNGQKEWFKEGNHHRINGPAIEYSDGSKSWWVDSVCLEPFKLQFLIKTSIFLGKEKGKYDLNWLRFLTEKGIEEFPIIPGMEQDNNFKPLFEKVFEAPSK